MSSIEKARTEPIVQLWDELDKAQAVMLGSPDHSQHMQPMAPQTDREAQQIWFYTRKNSEIARAAMSGGSVHMCLFTSDYQACVEGDLRATYSREHIERYWSSIVEAWYPRGKDDPDLIMLCLTPRNAAIWASTDSKLKFGWEIAKAIASGEEPHVGFKTEVNFPPTLAAEWAV